MNCVGRPTVEVRTAGSEKCCQSPVPTAKPMITKPAITISLVEVSTFCTLAVRPTPRQFSTVNAAISADAVIWPAPRRERKCAAADHQCRVGLLQRREEIAEVIGKGQRGGGDGRGEAGEERDPSGHEAPLGPVGVRQVHILAAGTGKIDAEFGIAERAGQGEQAAHRPAGQNQSGAAQVARHESGGGEDSGADHVGDDQGSGTEEPDLPKQSGSRDRREM